MSKTEQKTASNADILSIAQQLVGEDVADTTVAKADEPKEESGKAKQEAEESAELTTSELSIIVGQAVAQALAPLNAKLDVTNQFLSAIKEDGDTARAYLQANTRVLTKVKDQGEEYIARAAALQEVTKSLQVDVEAIGNRPGTPRSAVVVGEEQTVAKSASSTEAPQINYEKLAEIRKGMDIADALSVDKYLERGDYDLARSLLSPRDRKAIGL